MNSEPSSEAEVGAGAGAGAADEGEAVAAAAGAGAADEADVVVGGTNSGAPAAVAARGRTLLYSPPGGEGLEVDAVGDAVVLENVVAPELGGMNGRQAGVAGYLYMI